MHEIYNPAGSAGGICYCKMLVNGEELLTLQREMVINLARRVKFWLLMP